MSAIFGIVDFSGAAVPPQTFEAMASSLTQWGPDRRAHHVDGSAAIGQYLLYDTPESRFETLPRALPDQDLVFSAAARLDNRDELAREFALDAETLAITSDGDLALAAYRRWGEDCPRHLLGDWSLAAWHPSKRRLFLARDHLGHSALLYHVDNASRPTRLVFAPARQAMRAAGVPLRLDELHLAQILVSWPAYHHAGTIDLDVQRLPPAHALTATPESVRVWQYWSPQLRAELQTIDLKQAVEGFLSVYDDATRSRCRSTGKVAVTLSGGLDSGSVAMLAARALHERDERLLALTHVPRFDCNDAVGVRRFGDETEFAAQTAGAAGNIDHVLLASADIHPLDGIERSNAIHDQPTHAGSNAFWIHDLLQHAHQAGARVLLTGQGGNATVSWTGAPQFDSLAAFWRLKGTRETVKHLLPRALLTPLQHMRWRRQGFTHTAISPAFAQRIDLGGRRAAALGNDPSLGDNARCAVDMRNAIIKPGRSALGDLWARNGAAFGLSVRDPTCDARVMEFTLALPDRLFRGPDGYDRWLIREAMRGLMPDAVRLNRLRGRQSADIVRRLREQPERMQQTLDALAGTRALDYVDLAKLRSAWANVQSRSDLLSSHHAVTILSRGLTAALWINRQ